MSGTDVYFLLDRSGSMSDSTVIHELTEFLKIQNQQNRISLFFFNQEVEKITSLQRVSMVNIEQIENLYIPCGSTSLFDALDYVVLDAEVNSDKPPVIVIYTDGVDTSSKTCRSFDVRSAVFELQKRGWTFIFMGASPESYQSAGTIGIPRTHTVDAMRKSCFNDLLEYFS